MSVNLPSIIAALDYLGLAHEVLDTKHVVMKVRTETYVDSAGLPNLPLIVRVSEAGRTLRVFSSMLWELPANRVPAFAQVCLDAPWRMRMVRFQIDAEMQESYAMIEVPLEDASLTAPQLRRCLREIIDAVESFHPVVKSIIISGEIKPFGQPNLQPAEDLASFLAEIPDDVLADALRVADKKRRSGLSRTD